MRVTEILEYAQKHDVRVWADGNLLRIDAPRKAMTPDFREKLKQHKFELIAMLGEPGDSTHVQTAIDEHLQERAAIMEYDGGLPRKLAETTARKNLRVYEYRIKDTSGWLILMAPGSTLDEARSTLRDKFGQRFEDVREYEPSLKMARTDE